MMGAQPPCGCCRLIDGGDSLRDYYIAGDPLAAVKLRSASSARLGLAHSSRSWTDIRRDACHSLI